MSGLVMEGAVSEYDVATVLQAVSLSRQYTVIRLTDDHKRDMGEIRLKAGQVVSAREGAANGRSAFFNLLSKPARRFRVERLADSSQFPEPIGSVANLLLSQSAPAPADPQTTQTGISGPEVTRPAAEHAASRHRYSGLH